MSFAVGAMVRTDTSLGTHHGVVVEVLPEGYIVKTPGLGRLLCAESEVTAAFPASEPEPIASTEATPDGGENHG
jgi:hypothetical protein